MGEKISATIEDYLGVMYVLERDGDPATGVRLTTADGKDRVIPISVNAP